MNQILITKKLYVTPELKKKKKAYKVYFIISIIVVIVLVSFYIYSEAVRLQEENVAQDILLNMEVQEEEALGDGEVLVISLKENSTNKETELEVGTEENEQQQTSSETNQKTVKTSSGREYTTIATVSIPEINITYPVLVADEQTTESIEEALKVSPTKFWGPEPNQVGNFCIVGHNYRNEKFFSKVPTLENGAIIEVEDLSGKKIEYVVYDKYTVEPTDVSCTTQLTNGRKEVTLITCTDDSQLRVIVKAKEKK